VTTVDRVDLALFLPTLAGGGAERVMLDLAAGAVAQGRTVDLVVGSAVGPLLHDLPAGVTCVDLAAPRTVAALLPLRRYLRRRRPRALLSTLEHGNVVALLASRGLRDVRVAVREANTASRDFDGAGPRERVVLALMRLLYRRADVVVAVSRGVADDLVEHLRLPAGRIRVIENPVVTARLHDLATAPPPHPWFADGGAPVVLAVGRLTPQKRFDTLLRAFATARGQADLRLVVLGEGPERAALEALARELGIDAQVALPGFVDNPFAAMRHAGVFVLSSAWEGLPNALIQALALGAAVVSTDCPSGPREVLDGGELGELVPIDDAAALAVAMLTALARGPRPPPPAWVERYDQGSVVRRYLDALGVA
jgi:glycosyltransferase involved in cell wall biosynthesis